VARRGSGRRTSHTRNPEVPLADVWTHPSIRRFAGDADPVSAITAHARSVVLRAMDAGWSGPPFDPVSLAELLKIPVIPTDAVRDARAVPTGERGVQIEFNPNRPRGRVRFSVAHEIAHTFFPDCVEQVRNRSAHAELEGDDWQLEALCNIAAAEIVMPVASLSLSPGSLPGIEQLLEERRRFEVSTEALLIRAARTSEVPIAMFTASRNRNARYRLDYLIPSHGWAPDGIAAGLTLPANTHLAECMSLGFTSSGDEAWGRKELPVHVECVGIPPYPGGSHPRVAGVVWSRGAPPPVDGGVPWLRYVRGDATAPRGERSLIVHVVNDASPVWGGGGFAASLKRAYPSVQRSFKVWWAEAGSRRLGRVHMAEAVPGTWVASIVAQHGYGPSSTPRIRYEALGEGLEHTAAAAVLHDLTVHMPRIGAGQAGGRWDLIEDLIRRSFGRTRSPVTVYDLPPERSGIPRSTTRPDT
jgi:O-acetyl-ADP-ribose deacetylase (regulator of RNase III)